VRDLKNTTNAGAHDEVLANCQGDTMKKLFVVMSTVLLMLGVGTSRSFATAPDAQTNDEAWDINGVTNGYNGAVNGYGTTVPATCSII
jgi:hypothetical protein